MRKFFTFLCAAVLCCTSNVWAGELTVADGTKSNNCVPYDGYSGEYFQRVQIIYPQSELAAMAGKDITSLTFYVNSQASSALGVKVQIGLAEISDSDFSAGNAYKSATLTIVKAEDVWNLNAATVVVEFSEPFSYSGEGNILFDLQTVAIGQYGNTSFYGVGSLANYQSAYSYTTNSSIPATSSNRYKFIPKTTFTYEEPAADFAGEGTEQSPYLIATADDWNLFATRVSEGNTYSGKYFQLTTDIAISTMVGSDSIHAFKGIFDGDGHTITFERGDKMETYLAPFRYIGGATIQNVKTGGSITTSRQFTSGLVAYADGNNTITNCRASISIYSGCPDDGTHGGLVANIQGGTTTITGCIYGGNMQGALTTNSGGLVGWTEGNKGAQLSLIDCIFAPASLSFKDNGSKTLARSRNTSDVTITNCFYTRKLGDEQGTKLYSIQGDVGIGVENTDAVTKEYAAAGVAFCSTTLQFNGKIYASEGTNVRIRLSGNTAYSASSGTLSDNGDGTYTLNMPGENVIISGTGTPTSIDDIVNRQSSNRKFIKDGVLLIERDGKTYNAQGVEIR